MRLLALAIVDEVPITSEPVTVRLLQWTMELRMLEAVMMPSPITRFPPLDSRSMTLEFDLCLNVHDTGAAFVCDRMSIGVNGFTWIASACNTLA